MPQSLCQAYLHLVFSTKYREPLLSDIDFRSRTHAYIAGICQNLGAPSIRVGGVADHVHILCRQSRTISIADMVRDIKRDSSKWIKLENAAIPEFHWQDGYGAFSISPSHVEPLKDYIERQEEHHRTESFQEEFRRILRKNGIEFDERYVWD